VNGSDVDNVDRQPLELEAEKPLFDPVTGKCDVEELSRRCRPKPLPKPKAVTVGGRVVRDAQVVVSRADPNAVEEPLLTSIDPRYQFRPTVVRVRTPPPDWCEPREAGVRSAYDPIERAHREGPSLHRFRGDTDWQE
jgi:hypothetical protein